jgi:HEAT repeat protein
MERWPLITGEEASRRVSSRRDQPTVPEAIERFVKALVVCAKAVSLYPPASNIPLDTAAGAVRLLSEVLAEQPELTFVVSKQGLYYQGLPIANDQIAYENLALDLYNRYLAEVRFHVGVSAQDLVAFLGVLRHTPEELAASGGFENRLWESGVGTITVAETKITLLDAASDDLGPSTDSVFDEPLSRERIDEMLNDAYAGRPRDQLTIVRFLESPPRIAEYLTETFEFGGDHPAAEIGARFAQLAELAYASEGERRFALIQSLGDALADLDPEIRRILLSEEVLVQARTSDSLAAVVRQLDIDSVCRMLVENVADGDASRQGLARAVRNLALISMASREEIVSAAGAAMRGAGMPESAVATVLEMASPSRVMVRESAQTAQAHERPADTIFKLLDLAPTDGHLGEEAAEPELEELRFEARRGITDGDIIMTLVSLVGMDTRETQFASTMSMLEDSLELLIERGELEIAADSADALTAAARDLDLTEEQRARLQRSVGRLTRPAGVKAVAQALRLYDADSTEYQAARRLLDALGPMAIAPLLEQLAEETDMASRKTLVDLLCEITPGHVSELGIHVSDTRWFVVRNVVSILGSTKSSASLSYLQRTMRHPEPRVRRETVRALAGIPDRLATDMLIALLEDEDAQNVQLSARYLGSSGSPAALAALEKVARGEGRGNREMGPRVEAIEALGRIGDPSALPTLEALAGRRAIIGASKVRELRAAAESAIARIRAGKGGQA